MEAGKVKSGDHVHYIKFIENTGHRYEVEVDDVIYPGTRHERIRGKTFDVETGAFLYHEVKHSNYWPDKSKAVADARIQLVDAMQQLQAKAMSLGFFLK